MSAPVSTVVRATGVPPLGPESPVAWPKRTERMLSNGLRVIVAESRAFPKMAAQLYFRSGNSVVAGTKPGLADMAAGVVRTGTTTRTSHQIEDDLRRMGAALGSSAGADTTHISASGLAEFSDEILELISDLARNASFPEAEFDREKRQRFEEARIERTTPGFLASERLRRSLFGQHPYSVVAPFPEQIQSYERSDLQQFYRQHYSPANALLLIVGDFAAAEMLDQVEKIFGNWKGPLPEAQDWLAPPRSRSRQVHLVHLPGAVQTQVLLGNLAITRRDPDWFRLVLANAIYGGAFHSRLVLNIREQKGYTYSPRSSLHSLRQYGYFSVHAAVRNEVTAATLTEVFYELDRIRALPVSAEELEGAQSYLTGVFSLGVATQDGVLGQLSTLYLDGLPNDYLETYREKVRTLTAEDVLEAARAHFDSGNAQIVLVGDKGAIAKQAALFGQVTEYDAQPY